MVPPVDASLQVHGASQAGKVTMERHTWARLEEVFFQALELPLADRPAFLDRICGDDAAFRREIDAVLSGHYRAGGTQDALGLLPSVTDAAAGASSPGTRIGAYVLEELVGVGGMGEVYRGRRADDAYEQEVAVKLLRTGLRPPGGMPAVPAGASDSRPTPASPHRDPPGWRGHRGRPAVPGDAARSRGTPITTYVDRQHLPVRDPRLGSFVTVCPRCSPVRPRQPGGAP